MEYKAALECYESGFEGDPDFLEFAHGKTIRLALRIADKVMQEPSEGMVDVYVEEGYGCPTRCRERNAGTFRAMIEQMMKEVEND